MRTSDKHFKETGDRKHRMRRAAAVTGQVWGISKRRFGKNWEKKLRLFDRLV